MISIKSILGGLIIIIITLSQVNAFEHSYVKIYTDGLVKQDYTLSDQDWNAIILAVDYALVRVQSALDYLHDGYAYSEDTNETVLDAGIAINSAVHLLTLVKIATPTFEIHEQVGDQITVRKVRSLNLISYDARGDKRIVDVPLLKAFLVNAIYALKNNMKDDAILFLENAQESAIYDESIVNI